MILAILASALAAAPPPPASVDPEGLTRADHAWIDCRREALDAAAASSRSDDEVIAAAFAACRREEDAVRAALAVELGAARQDEAIAMFRTISEREMRGRLHQLRGR
jgi:hypothetical protein